MDDENDMKLWFPRLAQSGVPTPKTAIITTTIKLWQLLDGETPEGYGGFLQALEQAARGVGGPPFFLRTGHTSGKHDWAKSCCVRRLDALPAHVATLADISGALDFLGLPLGTWVVRELLDVQAPFRAFNGLPIGRERRYFLEGGKSGKVLCHHGYWPAAAVQGADRPDWRTQLDLLQEESPEEVEHLTYLTGRVARHFEGRWSLDWLFVPVRGWLAVDMAEMDRSFHWPGCKHAPKRQREEV